MLSFLRHASYKYPQHDRNDRNVHNPSHETMFPEIVEQ
jgi:hypothetical protein